LYILLTLGEGLGRATENANVYLTDPNNSLDQRTEDKGIADNYSFGDPAGSILLSQSQQKENISKDLDDRLQILYANRRIDQEDSPQEEWLFKLRFKNEPSPEKLLKNLDSNYEDILTPQTNISNKQDIEHRIYEIANAPNLNLIHGKNKNINNGQSIDRKILEELVPTIQIEIIQLIRDTVQKSSAKIQSDESLLEFVLKYSAEIISHSK
jgi:hypothetical protein